MIPDSSAQQSFLRKYKKRQQFICLMRLAVFLVFLLLWEVSARLGFIDSFIFGSPSQVCLAFRTLLLTINLLSHIGITVFETLASFFLVVVFSLLFFRSPLDLSTACCDYGALPCGAEQPSEVCTCPFTDRVAGSQL